MPSTRTAAPGSNPDDAPERYLSSPLIAGINIGLHLICRVARARKEAERRAMIWVHNYAKLKNLTADALSDELDLGAAEIRRALSDPAEDLTRFVAAVAKLRSKWESSLPKFVETTVATESAAAFKFALAKPRIVELIGRTRMGKSTTGARDAFYRNLDRAVWVDCPSDNAERSFIFAVAKAFGVSITNGKKPHVAAAQITSCLGPGLVELLVIDEGHFLWPANERSKPVRLEFLRVDCHADGRRAGILVIATPQHTTSLNAALADNGRWAPGQWEGRVTRFHLPDAMSEEELKAVARHHCPEATEDMVEDLALQAMAKEGYAGLMVNVIELARFKAGGKPLAAKHLEAAQEQMDRGTVIEKLAADIAKQKRGNARTGRRAA